ncbi:hypothetical protein Ciccas_013831 [Cichlidogyrus casuarinus]|uniref:N-acetyltransferase domain-containing protein n=1 Tax=Cichlidogyrus casuarinus TaxID=1844966 RepID=A0ABD2PJM3_9PLAT
MSFAKEDFEVRRLQTAEELKQCYDYNYKMMKSHEGMEEHFHCLLPELTSYFDQKICEGLIVTRKDSPQKVVGMLIFGNHYSTRYGGLGKILDTFYTDPDYRGKGLGRLLFEAFCQKIRAEGSRQIFLMHQTPMNVGKLYTKLGFLSPTQLKIRQLESTDWVEDDLPDKYTFPGLKMLISMGSKMPVKWIPLDQCESNQFQGDLETKVITLADEKRGLSTTYTEVINFDSWKGLRLISHDFVGDCDELICMDYLRFRAKVYRLVNPTLRKVVVNLECDLEQPQSEEERKRAQLRLKLIANGDLIQDTCISEQWNPIYKML